MRPEDKICYCYNVPFHKLWHFARRQRPCRASQMSDCLGAGTGCGWCIPFLKKIHAESLQADGVEDRPPESLIPLTPEEYADRRTSYIQKKEPRNQF
jgi:bacterioferritin-associated ferredoxin